MESGVGRFAAARFGDCRLTDAYALVQRAVPCCEEMLLGHGLPRIRVAWSIHRAFERARKRLQSNSHWVFLQRTVSPAVVYGRVQLVAHNVRQFYLKDIFVQSNIYLASAEQMQSPATSS